MTNGIIQGLLVELELIYQIKQITLKEIKMKTLNTQSTKEEEIQFLKKVASAAGDGSYLHSLLSTKLVGWMEDQIHNDFGCDLMGNWELAEEQLTESKRATRILEQQLEVANNLLKSTEAEYEARVKHAESIQHQLGEQLMDMTNQWHQALDEKHELEVLAQDRADEILRLKAALYDAEHPASSPRIVPNVIVQR
jgi:hypothetical protein